MTAARLQTVKEIFHAALDCEPDKLHAFLATECYGDEALRREVEALLTAHRQAGNFIQAPVAGLAANIVEKEQTRLLIGQTIGHYKISQRIGAGGMGEVYLAFDIIAGRRAALKLLPAHVTDDAERLKRFEQEARVIAGLNHPNILTIYEVGAENSTRYIASELVEGETLRQRLARGGLQLDELLEISIQVAAAVAAAHSAGVVHRDIKPENIMLRRDGYVKVLDFGIAKLAEQELPPTMAQEQAVKGIETNLGSIIGTVRYMSPEQARSVPVDKRTDIWSLGVVLYEAGTQRMPFTGETPAEVMSSILTKEPSPLNTYIGNAPSELQQIVTKALQKDPAQRYQSTDEMLEALKGLRRKLEVTAELERSATRQPWLRWTRSPAGVALAFLAGALVLALPFYWFPKATTNRPPQKSIAVLPFENLSADPQNAFFTDGMQDEILNDLAKIADLKVISRTSVMQYRSGRKRNLRQIANELGVAHVVEGSVQRAGNRVRVNAQLIDARNDAHRWAQTYDRNLADVFAIQSEVAKAIADQLHAKLSPDEKSAIEKAPTGDVTAFDLYSRARTLILSPALSNVAPQKLLDAAALLSQATTRDPSFFLAYCELAYAHDWLYFLGNDHTSARLASAETAIQAAFRLRPDAGEAHLARARNLYWGYLDYDGALAEIEKACPTLPNDARLFELRGYIERRRGRWDESTRDLERAIELDPRNLFMLQQLAYSYLLLRRYSEEAAVLDRALAINPNDVTSRASRGFAELDWKADTRRLHQAIESIRREDTAAIRDVADRWFICALAERDAPAAEMALAAAESSIRSDAVFLSRSFGEGLIGRMRNDQSKARAAFTAARAQQEKVVQSQPGHGPALCVLGLIDAALGHKEDALRENRRAIELMSLEKDPINGAHMIEYFAITAAWAGEKDLAIEQLATATRVPGTLSYGQLKLLPYWDPLRGDPRFERIVNSLAPK